ncbi:MAG: hydroxysqualene dehydroxylase HpnE [Chloroflexota bacterium]
MATGNVAVVGGGLAGLSAAHELKRRGLNVELFERSRLLGGKATSFAVGDNEVDNGQHVFLGVCDQLLDFFRESGVPSREIYLQPRFEALLLDPGRPDNSARLREWPLPAPLHLAPALLMYKHLSPVDRIKLALALLAARKPAPLDETFAAWLDRHRQSSASRRSFWEPFLVPALNAPLHEVGAEDALFVVRQAFLGGRGAARFGYARVPLGRLAERAARGIDRVHKRSVVLGVELDTGGVPLLRVGNEQRSFDGVVLAVPPERLGRLVAGTGLLDVDLAQFRTAAIVDVHLWYSRPFAFTFAAVLESPMQWIFQKAPGYLCCSMSAADEYVGQPGTELVELCHSVIAGLFPEAAEKLKSGAATRDREATFIPGPGLTRPGPLTVSPRITIAGAWTDTGWPATMESAVRSGRIAAKALVVEPLRDEPQIEAAQPVGAATGDDLYRAEPASRVVASSTLEAAP